MGDGKTYKKGEEGEAKSFGDFLRERERERERER